MKFKVNGREFERGRPTDERLLLAYESIVSLAGLSGSPSMVYSGPRKGDSHRSGILALGEFVEVEEGMTFTVAHTGSA